MRERFQPLRDVWTGERYVLLSKIPTYVLQRNIETLRDYIHENPHHMRRLEFADHVLDCFNWWKRELDNRKEAVPPLNEK